MSAVSGWFSAPARPTLGEDEVAVWRLPSDRPRPLETVLARYLGVDPHSLVLDRTPLGKPKLPGSPLRFSLAHSGDVALVAVARERDVGVDVERLRPDADRWAMVRHVLTSRERRELETVAPANRAQTFLSMWTRKEAVLKAAGVGLAIDPALVELEGLSLLAGPPELGALGEWSVVGLSVPHHVGALARRGGCARIQLYAAD